MYLTGMQCGMSITNHIITGSQTSVSSMIKCANNCLKTVGCETIMFEDRIKDGRQGNCALLTSSSSPYTVAYNSSVCYMSSGSVETTSELPTTPSESETTSERTLTTETKTTKTTTETVTTNSQSTTPLSIGETIIDMIDNLNNMCTQNSQNDIAIVTKHGIHLYDNLNSLTTGVCRNMTIEELFTGFSSLPDVNTWNAMLTYANNYFDLFTDSGQVYRWKRDGEQIVKEGVYPKTNQDYISDAVSYTAVDVSIFSRAQWAVYWGSGGHSLYLYDTSTVYYYRNQEPYEGSFPIRDSTSSSTLDNNGKCINLFYNLPNDVIAVTTQENSNTFLVIDVHLNVYFYSIPNTNNIIDYPPVWTKRGTLKF